MQPFTRTIATRLAALAGVVALVATAGSAEAQAAPRPDSGGVELSAADALSSATGLDRTAVAQQLRREAAANDVAARVTEALGADRTAGSWIDEAGRPHIAVVDDAAAAVASASGAIPDRVRFSQRDLAAVAGKLDSAARAGKVDQLQSWGVDPKTNQVVVTVRAGTPLTAASEQALAEGRRSGAIRVQQSAGQLTLAATLYGGREYQVNGSWLCSVGFNAKDSAGRKIMITAGHCTEGATSFTYAGSTLGTLRGTSFPTNDYGAINLASSVTQSPLIDRWDGYGVRVAGSTVAQVGATLCKSGRTTGWTCGTVQSFNNTVNYGGGDIVSGLTKHSACVEQGDSGGANMSGNQAQGVSSGGSLYQSGGRLVCGAKVGQPNESYFQPIKEALTRYGATLVTS